MKALILLLAFASVASAAEDCVGGLNYAYLEVKRIVVETTATECGTIGGSVKGINRASEYWGLPEYYETWGKRAFEVFAGAPTWDCRRECRIAETPWYKYPLDSWLILELAEMKIDGKRHRVATKVYVVR